MKRKIFALVATIGSMALLTGCQSREAELEKFVQGEWKLTSIESGDTLVEGEELELSYKGEVIYSFNEDNTGSVQISEQLVEGDWEVKGDTIVLTCNGLNAEFTKEDETLVANSDGTRVVLDRQAEEIPSSSEGMTDDNVEEPEDIEETNEIEE